MVLVNIYQEGRSLAQSGQLSKLSRRYLVDKFVRNPVGEPNHFPRKSFLLMLRRFGSGWVVA